MRPLLDTRQRHPDADLPALLRAAGEGDDRAWRTILDLYARRIYALAKSRVGAGGRAGGGHEIAEEITQSVFVTVASKLGSHRRDGSAGGYAEQGRFESWLFRVAMNRIRDEVRRRKRHAEPTDPASLGGLADRSAPPADPDAPDVLCALRAAVACLSEADREVVELRHHAGMSFKEISDLLNEPLGTLLARHHRALRKLKDTMTRTTDKAHARDRLKGRAGDRP